MKELLTHINSSLCERYSSRELETIVATLCLEYLEISQTIYYLKDKVELSSAKRQKLDIALQRLACGEPLQYVLGYTPFCGLQFKVNNSVLIPRPETAELVEWVLMSVKDNVKVIDIGTGSGCIAITLSHNLKNAVIDACDISDSALRLAVENNTLNGTNVNFSQRDILTDKEACTKYDVVVSNPPYITNSEKADMDDTVLDYEPHTALFVADSDPLLFYREIANFGKQNLNKDGMVFFEINPLFAEQTIIMLENAGYQNIELRKDIFGKNRMIKAVNL
ncbi:MAG: peptide chain release factor N(5)-glutamine methyltransferase [Bacteroidaceae bacterium]|nr:peptide chain release factor N(5)-glutamine methyltransferase [Bacteroidaceae bacterium]